MTTQNTNIDPNTGLVQGVTGSYNPTTTAVTFHIPDSTGVNSPITNSSLQTNPSINLGGTIPPPAPAPEVPPPLPIADAPIQTTNNDLTNQLMQGLGLTAGKAADTLNIQNDAQVQATAAEKKRLLDLYNTQAAEYNKLNAAIELGAGAKGLTTSMVTGQQAAVTRAKASNLESINAQYQIASGNYDEALKSAQRIVDLKYAPQEEQNTILANQLAAIKDQVTKDDKKQYDAQVLANQKQATDITDNKALAAEIAKNTIGKGAGDVSQAIDALSKATTYEEKLKIAAPYMATSDNQLTTIKNADGSEKLVLVDKRTGNIVKTISSGSSASSDTSTPTTAITVVNTPDGKVKPVTGYTLAAGDDPYTIAQNNGTNMDVLKKLNPNITNWTKLQPGDTINLPDVTNNWLNGKTTQQVQAYNSLPDSDKGVIQQLVTGNALLADVVRSRGIQGSAQIEKLVNEARKIDPNFSINQNKIMAVATKNWNDPNGKAFLTRSAMNTAMAHMATTYQTALSLGNVQIPKYNDVKNWLAKNTGNPELTNFVYDITALSGELASAYKNGTAPSELDTQRFYDALSGSMSPAQFTGAFKQSSDLMAGKLRSLAQEYKQSTGNYPIDPIVQPEVLSELTGAGIDTSSINDILKKQGYDISPSDNATLKPYGLDLPATNDILKQFNL